MPWGIVREAADWRRLTRALILSLALVVSAAAQSRPASPQRDDVEQLIDAVMCDEMPRTHAPGAVFVLVKDGHIELATGYGYADLEKKTPIDQDRTVLRMCSVSTTFTAAGAMPVMSRSPGIAKCDPRPTLRAATARIDAFFRREHRLLAVF
jgi:CubicO group peptidase (beta-lactamase class C family)